MRKSSDQRSVGSSPRLIAASYVLHRLLVPRHPPCALNNLATQLQQTPRTPPPSTTPPFPGHAPDTGRRSAGLQSKKMLASTVQFSTTNRPPPGTAPPTPPPAGPAGHGRRDERYEDPNGPATRTRP